MAVEWDTRLDGVVGRLASELKKDLGLETVGELLEHFPRRYLDMDEVSDLDDLTEGDLVMVVAEVVSATVHPYNDRRTNRMAYRTEVSARLGGGEIWMTFFDRNKSAADWRTGKLPARLQRAHVGPVRPQLLQARSLGAHPPGDRRGPRS